MPKAILVRETDEEKVTDAGKEAENNKGGGGPRRGERDGGKK